MSKYHHVTVRNAPTPEARLANLLAYFGWQGGTIHQLERETGVDASTLLHAPNLCQHIADDYSKGASALETCSKDWRVTRLAPQYKGNAAYWVGVAHALHVCPEPIPFG